jgi:hypothetical protein
LVNVEFTKKYYLSIQGALILLKTKREEHPVWDVYDEFRTARLNVKYLETQLGYLKKCNLIIESVLAFSASSSIAGLWFWESLFGGYLWKIIGSITAILAILKPILKLSDRIVKKEELLLGYKTLHHDLEKIKILISQVQKYDDNLKKQFLDVLERKKELVQKNIEPLNKKIRDKCQAEVINELPTNHFYIPRSDVNVRSKQTSTESAATTETNATT